MMADKPKVFVGRLPEGCTAKDLEDLFRTYGEVIQCDVIGKYGFVHMTKREEADEAIKKLNNYNFMGSQLTVQFSTSKKKEPSGKTKKSVNNRNKRPLPPHRNNSYPPSRGPMYGPPPSVAPSRSYGGGGYFDDSYRYDTYPYRESEQFYSGGGGDVRPPYDPMYGRRPLPQNPEYQRGPPLPPRDFYDHGDSQYSRPLPYDINRPIAPPEQRNNYGGPVRTNYGNGYGTPMAYPNRGPAGHRPPPPPTARWQPY